MRVHFGKAQYRLVDTPPLKGLAMCLSADLRERGTAFAALEAEIAVFFGIAHKYQTTAVGIDAEKLVEFDRAQAKTPLLIPLQLPVDAIVDAPTDFKTRCGNATDRCPRGLRVEQRLVPVIEHVAPERGGLHEERRSLPRFGLG